MFDSMIFVLGLTVAAKSENVEAAGRMLESFSLGNRFTETADKLIDELDRQSTLYTNKVIMIFTRARGFVAQPSVSAYRRDVAVRLQRVQRSVHRGEAYLQTDFAGAPVDLGSRQVCTAWNFAHEVGYRLLHMSLSSSGIMRLHCCANAVLIIDPSLFCLRVGFENIHLFAAVFSSRMIFDKQR